MNNILGVIIMVFVLASCAVTRNETGILTTQPAWIKHTCIVAGKIVPSWNPSEADRALTKQIIQNDTVFTQGNKYIKYDQLNESLGLFDQHGNRIISVESEGNNHQTKTFLLIDIDKKSILGIDQNLKPKIINQLSIDGYNLTVQYFTKKYNSQTASHYQHVFQKSQELIFYIDSLKHKMINQTGGYDQKNQHGFERLKGKANRSIASEFFIHKGHGKILENKINSLRNDFVDFGQPSLKVTPEQIPLKIDYEKLQQRAMDWPMYKFNQIPLAATLPMLTRIQVDACNSLNVLLKNNVP